MSRLINILCCSLVIGIGVGLFRREFVQAGARYFDAKNILHEYNKIGNYLLKRAKPTSTSDELMKLVVDLYRSEKQRLFSPDLGLIRSARIFLQQAWIPVVPCKIGAEILSSNAEIIKFTSDQPRPMLNKIWIGCGMKHYKKCSAVSLRQFQELPSSLPPSDRLTVEKVNVIFNHVAKNALHYQMTNRGPNDDEADLLERLKHLDTSTSEFIMKLEPSGSEAELDALYQALKELAKFDRGVRSLLEGDKTRERQLRLERLYQNYIVHPCQNYVFNRLPLQTALFTEKFYLDHGEELALEGPPVGSLGPPEYRLVLGQYKICDTFFVHPKIPLRQRLIEHIYSKTVRDQMMI